MGRTSGANATASTEDLQQKLVLTGADIMAIGEIAETIVGGKNYNTAHIHEIPGVRTPQFRAISSICFHKLLDETSVNAALVRSLVEKEYARIDWNDPEINQDTEFVQKLVRNLGKEIRAADAAQPEHRDARFFQPFHTCLPQKQFRAGKYVHFLFLFVCFRLYYIKSAFLPSSAFQRIINSFSLARVTAV